MDRFAGARPPVGLGISIQPDHFRWLACSRKATEIQIIAAAECQLPTNFWQQGNLAAPALAALAKPIKPPRHRYTTTMAIAAAATQNKQLTIATEADDDSIMAQIQRESLSLFGAPFSDLYVDYLLTTTSQSAAGANQSRQHVQVIAAPTAIVDPPLQGLTQAGYRIDAIELDSHAIIRACHMLTPYLQQSWQQQPQLLLIHCSATATSWWRMRGTHQLDAGLPQRDSRSVPERLQALVPVLVQPTDEGVLVVSDQLIEPTVLHQLATTAECYVDVVNPLALVPIAPRLSPLLPTGTGFVEAFGLALRGVMYETH